MMNCNIAFNGGIWRTLAKYSAIIPTLISCFWEDPVAV